MAVADSGVADGPVRFGAVDDHAVLLSGIEAIASRHEDRLHFVGTADTVETLLERFVDVEVVLLDLRLADNSRPRDNVRRLLEAGRRVLLFTEGDRESMIADAVTAGAQGVVLKAQAREEDLVRAIEDVADGALVLSAEIAAVLERDAELRPQLSPRERETLSLLAQGLADKQIARRMDIGEATVKENLKRVRVKYGDRGRPARSRVELHRRAIEDGYAEPDPEEVPEDGPEDGPEESLDGLSDDRRGQ